MPFLSICIPAHNVGRMIYRCLESIAAQDCSDYEVIIVDDGSENPLLLDVELLNPHSAYILSRVRIIRQKNAGTYAARQEAMQNARGDYVFCIDADDALAHPHVLKQLFLAIENEHPDVILFNAAREDGKPIVDYSVAKSAGIITRECVLRELAVGKPGWNSMFTMVFRRELFAPCSNRPRLVMAEDRLQKAEVLKNASMIMLLDEVFYYYSTVATSTMNAGFKPFYFDNLSYVEHQIRVQCQNSIKLEEREWARVYLLDVVLTSLNLLRRSPYFDTRERTSLYRKFRNDKGCENSLKKLERCDWNTKDWLCLFALRDRRMLMLDGLLACRALGGKVKRLLQRIRTNPVG